MLLVYLKSLVSLCSVKSNLFLMQEKVLNLYLVVVGYLYLHLNKVVKNLY